MLRIIRSRCADVLCFGPYWVGTLRRFMTLAHVAHLDGLLVCKHTHGELGIAAAAGQQIGLAVYAFSKTVPRAAKRSRFGVLTAGWP